LSQLVEVYLTVTKGKQLVPHLKASDFQVTEDGMPVSIDRLDSQEVPLHVVLLVDLSESIGEYLKTIQDAAAAFINSMSPEDRTARRYHWLSDNVADFVVEPHNAIVGDAKREKALNMTAKTSEG
jgi:hypothetical protein